MIGVDHGMSCLAQHQQQIHKGKKYQCRECDYQATEKSCLVQHQRDIHEIKKYLSREFDYQPTAKGSLIKHQQSQHIGRKYPCNLCSYLSTWENTLKTQGYSAYNTNIIIIAEGILQI